MKVALISYHKNAHKIYPQEWIEAYSNSILSQTVQPDIHELCYGGTGLVFWKSKFFKIKNFNTFVHAMNWMLDELFSDGYDCVANSNLDDVYDKEWIEKSIKYIGKGYDLVSCNFHLIDKDGKVYHTHNFEKLNIEEELKKNHNVICHPGVLYSKNFWERNRYIPEEIPFEDRELWKRAIKNSKFFIQPEHLVFHRVHDNSVCNSENR